MVFGWYVWVEDDEEEYEDNLVKWMGSSHVFFYLLLFVNIVLFRKGPATT